MKTKLLMLLLCLPLLWFHTAVAEDANAELISMQENDDIWVMPAKDYASTRFSTLDQITKENVTQLELDWTFSTGVLRGHEGNPLVINDTMYFVTPFPNILYALDITNSGAIKWYYEPENDPLSVGVACCDSVNRGVAYADGILVYNTLDGHVHAVDAESGEPIWIVHHADISKAETMTNAPLIANGKVIVGISGGEFGIRGRVAAYNLHTGDEEWLMYHTGPDDEVGIGERFNPHYEWLKDADLGMSTWEGDQWQIGGSSAWGWFSYDPELNLVYYGTSNPGTWNPSIRRAGAADLEDQQRYANLWSTSIMARDMDTGELIWAYPMTPHDEWDYDGVNEMILADLEIDGEMRKTLVHFDRNGFAYTIDRATGEVLIAEAFGPVNWADGIDFETGLPIRNPEYSTRQGVNTEGACPAAMGAKDQQPAAYSPITNLFYVPSNNLCMDYEGTEVSYISGLPYVGAIVLMYPGPGGHRGMFTAWDATTGEVVCQVKEELSVWGGALTTASNVVFYGTLDGWLRAMDADTCEILWQFKTGSGIIGSPMTYTGPDGQQYLAVLSGVGGWSGLVVAGDLSLNDPTAALGAVNAFSDLGRYTRKGGMLYIFKLPADLGETVAQAE